MADMEIAVGLGWKAGMDPALIFTGFQIFYNYFLDEMGGNWKITGHIQHSLKIIHSLVFHVDVCIMTKSY
jgi:hypothetical protein